MHTKRTISLLYVLVVFLAAVFPCRLYAAAAPKEPAPDFELADLNGTPHKLTNYRGKVVILNFWATWCPDCVKEMPSLEALHTRFQNEDVVIIGISIDRSRKDIDRLKTRMSYPVLVDDQGEVFVKKYTVTRLPVTVIVDKEGLISEKLFGPQDFISKKFVGKINDLLKQKAAE